MSQNHLTANGIIAWDQIDNPTFNTVGQYHGNAPWFYTFGAQTVIHDLGRTYPRIYATWLLQTRVYIVLYGKIQSACIELLMDF